MVIITLVSRRSYNGQRAQTVCERISYGDNILKGTPVFDLIRGIGCDMSLSNCLLNGETCVFNSLTRFLRFFMPPVFGPKSGGDYKKEIRYLRDGSFPENVTIVDSEWRAGGQIWRGISVSGRRIKSGMQAAGPVRNLHGPADYNGRGGGGILKKRAA